MTPAAPRRKGRPTVPAAEAVAARRPGWRRFSIEMPLELVEAVEASATADERDRAAQIRVLCAEALAARGEQKKR